ncbi:MAG: mechanosensitive ion channel family protein [Gammaproteobacteria bacterium]
MSSIRLMLCMVLCAYAGSSVCRAETPAAPPAEASAGTPLVVGHRMLHVFRAPSGMFTASERAESAKRRIEQAFEQRGEGWTSIRPTDHGLQVELDGRPLFLVLPGDAVEASGETPEDLANQASRALQKAWAESRERRNAKARMGALLRLALASAVLIVSLGVTIKLAGWMRARLLTRLRRWMQARAASPVGQRMAAVVPDLCDRLLFLSSWLLGLAILFVYLTYSLAQLPETRPAGERLARSFSQLAIEAINATAAALPGVFIAALIFLAAWVATRLSREFFASVQSRPADQPGLNAHNAPATRRIVNAALWLFALAMAYPYLPGSHTEAFRGLSVILGLMVSIGAAGVVGQIASGILIVYTYALKEGEYVRIQDHEGTVTEISMFVTRLRTGHGEEISIPNALVLGSVTRNFSRATEGGRYVLDTTVTIGYDAPWRQVHAMLIEAARTVPEIMKAPEPYVVQTALSDFYVEYKLVVQVSADVPATRARVASDLHSAIQDAFNRRGVQIMSPHYEADPDAPKLVREADWYSAPAEQEAPR